LATQADSSYCTTAAGKAVTIRLHFLLLLLLLLVLQLLLLRRRRGLRVELMLLLLLRRMHEKIVPMSLQQRRRRLHFFCCNNRTAPLLSVCLFVSYPIVLNSGAKEERFFLFEKGKDARDDVLCSRLQEVAEEERCRQKRQSPLLQVRSLDCHRGC
jgi:hypothetical protein